MKYLKLYENFELSNEIWVIMDEKEELIYGDVIDIRPDDDDGMSSRLHRKKYPKANVLIPTENANRDTFQEFSFGSKADTLSKIETMTDVYIGYDYTPSFGSNWKMRSRFFGGESPNRRENPYKRWFSGDDLKLKPVKYFMGIMKADNLNI